MCFDRLGAGAGPSGLFLASFGGLCFAGGWGRAPALQGAALPPAVQGSRPPTSGGTCFAGGWGQAPALQGAALPPAVQGSRPPTSGGTCFAGGWGRAPALQGAVRGGWLDGVLPRPSPPLWIPAFAGMTGVGAGYGELGGRNGEAGGGYDGGGGGGGEGLFGIGVRYKNTLPF